jgi:hypothetical protein
MALSLLTRHQHHSISILGKLKERGHQLQHAWDAANSEVASKLRYDPSGEESDDKIAAVVFLVCPGQHADQCGHCCAGAGDSESEVFAVAVPPFLQDVVKNTEPGNLQVT